MKDPDKKPEAEEPTLPADIDVIRASDLQKPVTVAQFKRWRTATINDINRIIAGFQQDIVRAQAYTNLAWNGMNAVLLVLLKKGLVTDSEIAEAGATLMAEAKRNMETTKAAMEAQQRVNREQLLKTPLEHIKDLIYPTVVRTNAEEGATHADANGEVAAEDHRREEPSS